MAKETFAKRAMLFDFDGTLVNTAGVWRSAKIQFLSNHTSRAAEIAERYNGVGLRVFAQAVTAEGIVRNCTLDNIVDAIDRIASVSLSKGTTLMPGAERFVRDVASLGYLLAVCSNAPSDWISDCLSKHHLRKYFKAIFSTAGTSYGKPHPHVYLKALAELSVSAEAALAFEDSMSGVRAAKDAGLQVIFVGQDVPTKCNADAVYSSLADIDTASIAHFQPAPEMIPA